MTIVPPEEYSGHRSRVERLVPSLVGWSSFPRAFVNLLVFGLAVAGGEWLVHQIEYLIEYGRAFGTVTGATSRHAYMGELGLALAAAAIAILILSAATVGLHSLRLWRILRRLPARLDRFLPAIAVRVPIRAVLLTALAAALGQIALYVVQENLESAAIGSGWPGLSVLFDPRHATVVPLHSLVALCGSLLLWTLSVFLRGSRAAVRAAEAIAELIAGLPEPPRPIVPVLWRAPCLRPARGTHGLRSPPVAV